MQTPENVIELLQRMVRMDSVNGAVTGVDRAEQALAQMLAKIAGAWLMEVEWLPMDGGTDQLLLTHRVGDDRPWLLFDSHMDTVSVEGMTIDPFGGALVDGNVLGRGACDTKGTGAAMMWAFKQYGLSSDRPNNIAMLFSIDEEIAMTGIQSFVNNDLPRLSWSPGMVIVGEPTEHTPVVAHNGCVRFEIITHGKAAHSSLPSEGRSAIADMVKLLSRLQSRYIEPLDAQHPLTGYAACSVNVIRGGSAPNIIPERCVAEVDRRLIPGEAPEEVLPTIAALFDELVENDAGLRYALRQRVCHPPLDAASSASVLPLVKQAMAAHDVRRPTVGAPFCTHASYLAAAGLPTLVFGPGSPHAAHTKDEWVSVKEIELGAKVYETLMRAEL